MWSRRTRPAVQSRGTVLLALLCIVLLLFAAAVQTVHTHQDGTMHGDCALCVSAHAVLSVVVSLTLALSLEVVAPLLAQRKKTVARFDIPFALSIRPPPDPAALS